MLRVTAISAGEAGVEYLLGRTSCTQHQIGSPERYYLTGAELGPVGRWAGTGAHHLGLAVGAEVTEADVRAVLGQLCDPRLLQVQEAEARARIAVRLAAEDQAGAQRRAQIHAEEMQAAAKAARLGRQPMRFRSLEERIASALEREGLDPDDGANAERIAQITETERQNTRQPVGYFDATFSPAKSVSVYHAGLLAQGRDEDAATVVAAHHAGVSAALAYWQAQAGYSRAGYHGKAAPGRASIGRYVEGHEWIAAAFDHQTSRSGEPQLHTHLAILNRVRTVDPDGQVRWRTLDSRSLNRMRAAAAAIYERTLEQTLECELPVVFEMRPDGQSREIRGISAAERDAFSSRRVQVKAKLAEYVEAYKASHGAEPSKYLLTLMAETAALTTRAGKEPAASAEELLDRWERLAAQRLATSLAAVAERAEAEGIRIRRTERTGGVELDRDAVVVAGIERIQTERATWTRADLIRALNQELPGRLPGGVEVAGLLEELADQALSGRYGTVQVDGFELVSPPPELRRASDGKSIYRPGHDERYATLEHLSREEQFAARVASRGGIALDPLAIEGVVERSGASGDQAAAIRGVLGDGRKISVVIGPAGAGKSYTQGVIAAAWREHTAGRVIGLGPSSTAAEVLAEEGIEVTTNTTRFLDYASGRGALKEVERFGLRAGDLVIVDEAGMASTEHLCRITELAQSAGAKVVLVGDDAQLTAVDAGGAFRLARQVGTAYELDTVRRFREADGQVRTWEAQASLQLRDGDVRALAVYDRHGRFMGGTEADMAEAAIRAYVADVLGHRDAVLVTGTVEKAAELSGGVREQLVRFGLVEAEGVRLADRSVAGRGDLIQTRENDHQLRDSDGRLVLNRRMYRVIDRHADGALTVRRIAGRDAEGREQLAGEIRLPAGYVAEHVSLGYAGTVHAVQGRTVRRGYLVADATVSREQLYVALSRGWESNRAFVTTQRSADAHQPHELDSDPLRELTQMLEVEQAERSARETLRESLEHAEWLPALAPIWADVIAEHTRVCYEQQLAQLLSAQLYEELLGQDPDSVYRLLRQAELAGHDASRLLAEAISRRPMTHPAPDNVAALLSWRIEGQMTRREPEGEPAETSWLSRTPADLQGARGQYARAIAAAMDARRETLGEQSAADPPAWALAHLGPVPHDLVAHAQWVHRAGMVAGYRELYQMESETTALGRAPSRDAVEQHTDWQLAHAALGGDDHAQRLAQMPAAGLRQAVQAWERDKAWAPVHVVTELGEAEQTRIRYAEKAELAQAQADRAADPQQRRQLREQAAAYEQLVAGFSERIEVLERIQSARQAWYAETAPAREAGEAAAAELARREREHRVEHAMAAHPQQARYASYQRQMLTDEQYTAVQRQDVCGLAERVHETALAGHDAPTLRGETVVRRELEAAEAQTTAAADLEAAAGEVQARALVRPVAHRTADLAGELARAEAAIATIEARRRNGPDVAAEEELRSEQARLVAEAHREHEATAEQSGPVLELGGHP